MACNMCAVAWHENKLMHGPNGHGIGDAGMVTLAGATATAMKRLQIQRVR